jgi:Uma2 family endonuclease
MHHSLCKSSVYLASFLDALTLDPPPDLVIEIDVTSYSDVQDYLPHRVLEVWLFKRQQILIYQL